MSGPDEGAVGDHPGEPSLPLARRSDFRLGAALIRPSRRKVEGPAGEVVAEPRVMQVLLALADSRGSVLSREDLLRLCWGGRIVGDDAINRAIAEVRRLAAVTAGGFAVETVPRVGYRLTEAASGGERAAGEADGVGTIDTPGKWPRRSILVGTAALSAAAAAGAFFLAIARKGERYAQLIERANQLNPDGTRQGSEVVLPLFREAVAIEPARAEGWGLLALAAAEGSDIAPAQEKAALIREAEAAARKALELDSSEPNAQLALVCLQMRLDDAIATEDKLLRILRTAPRHVPTIEQLLFFLQGVGRNRDSWEWNERAVALEPLSPGPRFRKALKHWIFGRVPEADEVIGRATELWPRHPWVWNARLLILAFTDRPHAALKMINDVNGRPPTLAAPAINMWRAALQAMITRRPADLAAARSEVLRAAPIAAGLAAYGTMILSYLKETDAAFAVVDGFLLQRGALVANSQRAIADTILDDGSWQRTQWLFTPACEPLRDDRRFAILCDNIGLSQYWRRRGIVPDYRQRA